MQHFLFPARAAFMFKIFLASLVVVVAVVIGGGTYLAFFDIPAPSAPTKIVLPDARFPQ